MKNLFKYASEHWKALLAIVAILIVQAYCDLSLPAYTSDIVNVGIQQGGVEDHIPDAISAEDMETLLLFTSEKDGKTVLSAYEKDDKTYEEQAYVLKDTVKEDTDRTEKLSGILAAPMMMAAGFESGSDMTAGYRRTVESTASSGNDIGRYDGFGYFENDAAGAETGICIGDRKKDGRTS